MTEEARKKKDALALFVGRWWFVAVSLAGLAELALHVRQARDVVSPTDWAEARAVVARALQADDQILFAPQWADAVGRQAFGPDLVTIPRAARPDDTRFARVFVVSIRGEGRAEVAGWKVASQEKRGAVTVSIHENPSFKKPIDDLIAHVNQGSLVVESDDRPCPWTTGSTVSGGVYYPFGMAIPGDKFQCPMTLVGVSVIQALDHSPRRCILAAPPGAGGTLRMRFAGVTFGKSLHGHHGIHYEAERHLTGAPVTLDFKHDGRIIGRSTHRDGQGWNGFEFETAELDGKRAELAVEVTAASNTNRKYCFEADTR